MIRLKNKSPKFLLGLYANIIRELRDRKIVRSSNNPCADYAEFVACKKLRLKMAPKVTKSYDAVDRQGQKYQIKSRRLTKENFTQLLGVIRYLDKAKFHYLLGVVFNEDFSLKEIIRIPKRTIKKYAKFSRYQNGHILNLHGEVRRDPMVKRVA